MTAYAQKIIDKNVREGIQKDFLQGFLQGFQQGLQQGKIEGQTLLVKAVNLLKNGKTEDDLRNAGFDDYTINLALTLKYSVNICNPKRVSLIETLFFDYSFDSLNSISLNVSLCLHFLWRRSFAIISRNSSVSGICSLSIVIIAIPPTLKIQSDI